MLESYANDRSGDGPPNDAGTRNGYPYVNDPLDPPADHEYAGDNDVAANDPSTDAADDVAANTTSPDEPSTVDAVTPVEPPGTVTSADSTPAPVLVEATSVCVWHDATSGVVTA